MIADRVLARWRAARERRLQRRLAATRLLEAFAEQYPEAFAVEIGANDGVEHDPVHPFVRDGSWRALMVEPAPGPFERLRRNYADAGERVAFEQAAIADRDGTVPFFHLERVEGGRTERLDVFGSLSRAAVEASAEIFVPAEQRRIVEGEVPCLTLESLWRRHGVERVDLLAIDAEGSDQEILEQVDLERLRPRLLAYEHLFLSADQREECRSLLERAGYETVSERRDTWALDTTVEDRLTQRWRGLRPAVPADSIRAEPGAP